MTVRCVVCVSCGDAHNRARQGLTLPQAGRTHLEQFTIGRSPAPRRVAWPRCCVAMFSPAGTCMVTQQRDHATHLHAIVNCSRHSKDILFSSAAVRGMVNGQGIAGLNSCEVRHASRKNCVWLKVGHENVR